MPTFQYEAMDQSGQPVKSTIEAPDSDEALNKIRAQGYFPTSVREKKVRQKQQKDGGKKEKKQAQKAGQGGGGAAAAGGTATRGGTHGIRRVKPKLLTQFTRQLSTLQDAGLPILRSLQILEEQQPPGKLKNILSAVQEEVEGGASLSEAMSHYPKAFDRLYTKMVAAGEVGGVLDVILRRLADFMEKAERLKKRIISAMIYPAAVISIAVLLLTGIMIFIIPKFKQIFKDFDTELPAVTQMLIGMSDWVAGTREGQMVPGWLVIILAPFVIVLVTKLLRQTPIGRTLIDNLQLSIPVVGKLVQYSAIAKFTRTLGTLVAAGVPILEAILISRDTVGNSFYEHALQQVHDAIREGEPVADPLRRSRACDPMVTNMIDVGEETGELDTMLIKVADNYDEHVDNAVSGLVSLLEPIMVIVLGLSVGFIVIALFVPLVKLIQSASNN